MMARKDLEEMYEMVHVGDSVELIGQRNEETAELFGEPKPAAAEQPVVVASAAPEAAPSEATNEVAAGVVVSAN